MSLMQTNRKNFPIFSVCIHFFQQIKRENTILCYLFNGKIIDLIIDFIYHFDLKIPIFLFFLLLFNGKLWILKTHLSSIISENVFDFLRLRSISSISSFLASTTRSIICSTRFLREDFQLSRFCKHIKKK